jgi:hypothetical protein
VATTTQHQDGILPEEEALFREFQSYVRSIYMEASQGVLDRLEGAADAYKRNTDTYIQSANAQLQQVVNGAANSISGVAKQSEQQLQEVTSISTLNIKAASQEAQQAITNVAETLQSFSQAVHAATERLNRESEELSHTVRSCRQDYANLFEPAIQRFSEQALSIIQLLSEQKDQILVQSDAELKRSAHQVERRIAQWEQESTQLFQQIRQHLMTSEQSLGQQIAMVSTNNDTNLQTANQQLKGQLEVSKQQMQQHLEASEKRAKNMFAITITLLIMNIAILLFFKHR